MLDCLRQRSIAIGATFATSATLLLGCRESEQSFGAAGEHLIAAREALAAGDSAAALVSLNASIEAEPNVWAYIERAKLRGERGEIEAAQADCRAGLELLPENRDLKWMLAEFEKPANQRFKGRNATPPTASK